MGKKVNLKSKRILLFVSLFICFVFSLLFIFNYYTYNSIFLNKLFDVMIFNDDNYSSDIINRDLIEQTEVNDIGVENSIGISVNNYSFELNNNYDYISTISVKVNKDSKYDNFTLLLSSNSECFDYNSENYDILNDGEIIFVINESNIDKINIRASIEDYDTDDGYDSIFQLEQIQINDNNDIKTVKEYILFKTLSAVLFILIIILTIVLLKKTQKRDNFSSIKIKLPKIFLLISIIFGIIFSVLFPLYQIPDELTHINMIYEEMNMDVNFYNETNGFGDTNRIAHNYNEKVNIEEYFDFSEKLSISENYNIPKITLIKHFPQAIGMIVCEIFNFPIIVSITFAEVLAVLFYSFICYRALKIIPIKKELMMAIMLLPICLQQMGSFSYDAVLLPICFYLISYILYLKLEKKDITLNDCMFLLILLFLIALIKIPYILLGGLIFLIPISKLNLNFHFFKINYDSIKNNKKKLIVIFMIFILFSLIIAIKILSKISYGRILIAAFLEPLFSIKLIFNSINIYKFGYIKELTGNFGWFDTPTSLLYTIFILISVLIISFMNFKVDGKKKLIDIEDYPFTFKDLFLIYFLGIIMIFLIILSMFSWTVYVTGYTGIDTYSLDEIRDLFKIIKVIGGVQGRYFIPIIPLFLIPLYSKKITKILSKFNLSLFLVIYYFILFLYMFIVVLNRYWIS